MGYNYSYISHWEGGKYDEPGTHPVYKTRYIRTIIDDLQDYLDWKEFDNANSLILNDIKNKKDADIHNSGLFEDDRLPNGDDIYSLARKYSEITHSVFTRVLEDEIMAKDDRSFRSFLNLIIDFYPSDWLRQKNSIGNTLLQIAVINGHRDIAAKIDEKRRLAVENNIEKTIHDYIKEKTILDDRKGKSMLDYIEFEQEGQKESVDSIIELLEHEDNIVKIHSTNYSNILYHIRINGEGLFMAALNKKYNTACMNLLLINPQIAYSDYFLSEQFLLDVMTNEMLQDGKSENILIKLLEINSTIATTQYTKGNTIFHLAAKEGNKQFCLKALKEYPETITIRNNNGNTFIHTAINHGMATIGYKALTLNPELGKIVNNNGKTFIHLAAENLSYKMAQSICLKALCTNPELATILNHNGETFVDTFNRLYPEQPLTNRQEETKQTSTGQIQMIFNKKTNSFDLE